MRSNFARSVERTMHMTHRIQKTISPVDGSVYVERPVAGNEELGKILEHAALAQKTWKQVPVAERVAICRRMADWCVEHADRFGEEITRQMGRPIAYSPFEIRRGFHERATYMTSIAESTLEDIAIEPKPGFQRFIRREPLGVV